MITFQTVMNNFLKNRSDKAAIEAAEKAKILALKEEEGEKRRSLLKILGDHITMCMLNDQAFRDYMYSYVFVSPLKNSKTGEWSFCTIAWFETFELRLEISRMFQGIEAVICNRIGSRYDLSSFPDEKWVQIQHYLSEFVDLSHYVVDPEKLFLCLLKQCPPEK